MKTYNILYPSKSVFPSCKGCKEAEMVSCIDIMRHLENRSSKKYIEQKLSKWKDFKLEKYQPTHIYENGKWSPTQNDHDEVTNDSTTNDSTTNDSTTNDSTTNDSTTNGSTTNDHDSKTTTTTRRTTEKTNKNNDNGEYMICLTHVPDFIHWCLKRARKRPSHKKQLLRKFSIETTDIDTPIQQECEEILFQCIPTQIETEYSIGPYRLDIYFPYFKLAVEIDEKGHTGYNKDDEERRCNLIQLHGITLLRFNPHAKLERPLEYELVRMVNEYIINHSLKTPS
jgi:very-short-patch-repair endonuclease